MGSGRPLAVVNVAPRRMLMVVIVVMIVRMPVVVVVPMVMVMVVPMVMVMVMPMVMVMAVGMVMRMGMGMTVVRMTMIVTMRLADGLAAATANPAHHSTSRSLIRISSPPES